MDEHFTFLMLLANFKFTNKFLHYKVTHFILPLVFPYFYYCIIVLDSTCSSNLNKPCFSSDTYSMTRIVNKEEFDAHTNSIFKELMMLKFEYIYLFHLDKFMYTRLKIIQIFLFVLIYEQIKFIAIIQG